MGDATALEVPDASFDVVLSVLGVIFAPDHARAVAEMARACRPGGTVAITTWSNQGWSPRWRGRISRLLPAPPPGSPRPDEWGDPDEVIRRFAAAGLTATVEQRPFAWAFPSLDAALAMFLNASGPFIQMIETATALGRDDDARHELRAALEEANEASDGSCLVAAPYLLAIAPR